MTVNPETYDVTLSPSHLKALRQLHAGTSSGLIPTMVLRGLQRRGLVDYAGGGLRELTGWGRALCRSLFDGATT